MSGAIDDALCKAVRWCDELADHRGPHRRTLFDAFDVDLVSGRPQVVQVNLQGVTTNDRVLVLITGLCQTTTPWAKTRDHGQVLRDQARMHGAP